MPFLRSSGAAFILLRRIVFAVKYVDPAFFLLHTFSCSFSHTPFKLVYQLFF